MNTSDADKIRTIGHRNFVGGNGKLWHDIAKLQFDFLLQEGLKSHHVLLDVACGSLRAGQLFIDYLEPGNYLGIDKEINLIIHGVSEELGLDVFIEKKPEFIISETFEFNKFSIKPNYAIAQSLLTHLTSDDIYLCLKSLRSHLTKKCSFYATFFEVPTSVPNLEKSDSTECFFYTREEIEKIAELTNWTVQYIGEWGHPRDQKIIKLEPK